MSIQQSTETDLYVDWQGYHRMIERLALQIYESGWHFDVVLCLARGGLVAGNVLCRIFDKPLAVLSTSSYRESIGTVQGALDIAKNITMTQGELSGSVLLVDDLIDTGVTLAAVKAHIDYMHSLLEERRWLAGPTMTIADFAAAAHFSCLDYISDVDGARSDLVRQWYATIKSRPAFRGVLADQVPGMHPAPHYAELDF